MKLKISFFTFGFLFSLGAVQAYASDSIAVQMECKGSKGTLKVSHSDRESTYSYTSEGLTFERTLDGSAYTSLENPPRWLSISGSKTKQMWEEGHYENWFDRAGRSHKRWVPGQFVQRLDEWIDVMLDTTPEGTFTFNRIEIDLPEFKGTLQNLGDNTVCNGSASSL